MRAFEGEGPGSSPAQQLAFPFTDKAFSSSNLPPLMTASLLKQPTDAVATIDQAQVRLFVERVGCLIIRLLFEAFGILWRHSLGYRRRFLRTIPNNTIRPGDRWVPWRELSSIVGLYAIPPDCVLF
jgi:hypothetical protein